MMKNKDEQERLKREIGP